MGPLIRASSLRGFADLVEELGGEPGILLDRFGIAADALSSDDGLVSITAHDLMLDAAAEQLGCPDLGLRLAERQDLSILGPLAVAIESSSTVADAVECAARFMFVHSPALQIGVVPDPRGVRGVVGLTYRKDLLESPYSPQAMELGLGLFHRIARALTGGLVGLRSVELPHAPLSPVRRYLDFFGCEVRFGAATAALRADRSLLDRAFDSANATVRELALAHLTQRASQLDASVAARVRRVACELLATGGPSVAQVSHLLEQHPRTLQRRLAGEGTTFAAVVDDARRDAAHRYLTTTDLPMSQVAALSGFAEQSSLSHAVRRWYAVTPRELRRLGR